MNSSKKHIPIDLLNLSCGFCNKMFSTLKIFAFFDEYAIAFEIVSWKEIKNKIYCKIKSSSSSIIIDKLSSKIFFKEKSKIELIDAYSFQMICNCDNLSKSFVFFETKVLNFKLKEIHIEIDNLNTLMYIVDTKQIVIEKITKTKAHHSFDYINESHASLNNFLKMFKNKELLLNYLLMK